MRDSLEDRICAAGKHDQFTKAVEEFRGSAKNKGDEHRLYDTLTNLGANPEEADEFVNMELDNG